MYSWFAFDRPALRRLALLILVAWCAGPALALTTRYAAPTAQGTGDGTSKANAALYTSSTFWNNTQTLLGSDAVQVIFVNGTYANSLTLTLRGHATNQLSLVGESATGTVFNGTVSSIMTLAGCRNMVVRDFNFRGAATSYALRVTQSGTTPSTNVTIESCSFVDMTSLVYGALGIHYGSNYIYVFENEFRRCGVDSLFHFIYAAYDPHHIYVSGNVFEDSGGAYVRFRDNADHGHVTNNFFNKTGTFANADSTKTIFVDIPTFNDVNPGDETIASNYVVTGNTFRFHSSGPDRRAYNLTHSGYDPSGLSYLMTASEGTMLERGTPAQIKNLLATEADIQLDSMIFEGNSYINADTRQAFRSAAMYGAVSQGWDGTANISDAYFTRDALMKYDFEFDHETAGGWWVSQNAGTAVSITTTDPAEGAQSVRLTDNSTSNISYIRKYISPIERGYFSAWYKFGETNQKHYPLMTDSCQWLVAGSSGLWGNGNGDFSPAVSYNANQWYFAELSFDCNLGTYSVWINGVRVANQVAIPGAVSSMSGTVGIQPSYSTATGSIWVDDLQLLDYDAALHESAMARDGFERDPSGTNPYGWEVTEYPSGTTVSVTTAQKATGANSVYLYDNSTTNNCNIRRTVPSPIYAGYAAGWFRFAETNANHYPIWSSNCYWLIARSDGKWGNGNGAFTASYSASTWYYVQMRFDFHRKKYTIWVNGTAIATDIAIPGTATAFSSQWTATPATAGARGSMWVDDIQLIDYYAGKGAAATFRDGFETSTGNPPGWETAETAGYAEVNTATSGAAVGSKSIHLNDMSTSHNCSIRRAVPTLTHGYFSIWAKFGETNVNHYPIWTDNTYWVIARSSGRWGNNTADFSPAVSYVANQWYFIEIIWDYRAANYSVWIDGQQVADRITIPGTAVAFSGNLVCTPTTISSVGQMWVDEPTLIDDKYEVLALGDWQLRQ